MCSRLIEVVGTRDGHDGFEMRRAFHGSFHLRSGKITDADHTDVAIRPTLLGRPLYQVIHIATLLPIKEPERSARAAGASAIRDHVDVTPRNKEIACTRFNESCGSTEVLNLTRIRRSRNQHRIASGFGGAMYIRQQTESVAHRHRDVVILSHGVRGL